MAQQMWTISGKLRVETADINGVLTNHPVANAEVEVEASNFGIYASWGTVRTDSSGNFSLRNEKDRSKRKFRIKVRLADDELEVNTGALAGFENFLSPKIVVFEHANEVEGPTINIGDRTFKTGASGQLGIRTNVRQATTWYLIKTIINKLQAVDSYFDLEKVKIIYPANVLVSKTPYANGITRCAYIHADNNIDWWSAETVAHEFFHLWNYQHNTGTANWLGAVACPPDLSTHGEQERRPISFHEGFAKYAAQSVLYELWGGDAGSNRSRPLQYTRYALVHSLHLDSVDEVERSDEGVYRALALLTTPSLYQLRFGDKDTSLDTNPFPQSVRHPNYECPAPPALDVWDVLKVFQANSAAGWPTEWQVGNNEYGVRRFFERAADVLSGLDDPTKDLLLSLIDPDNTEEPLARCTFVRPTAAARPTSSG
jgi:hypothetical protein